MQQVLAIHGGTSFDTYNEYLRFLKTREVTRERLLFGRDWKANLAEDLGEDYEVLVPKMPNGANAEYVEWQIWFERCAEIIASDVILIGHSLGGIFLAKYLAENDCKKQIRATILVAAPFDAVSTEESLNKFTLPPNLRAFAEQSPIIQLMHSEDDPVVPFTEAAKYQAALPHAKLLALQDRGHCNDEHFLELVNLIKSNFGHYR